MIVIKQCLLWIVTLDLLFDLQYKPELSSSQRLAWFILCNFLDRFFHVIQEHSLGSGDVVLGQSV